MNEDCMCASNARIVSRRAGKRAVGDPTRDAAYRMLYRVHELYELRPLARRESVRGAPWGVARSAISYRNHCTRWPGWREVQALARRSASTPPGDSPVSPRRSCLTAIVLASAIIACGQSQPAPPAPVSASSGGECSSVAAEQMYQRQPAAEVILLLRPDIGETTAAAQERVLRDLGADFQLGRQYRSTNALAGTLSRKGFERARAHPRIRCVQLDGSGRGG